MYLDPEALEERVEDILRKDSGCEMSIPSSPEDDFYGFSYDNTGFYANQHLVS